MIDWKEMCREAAEMVEHGELQRAESLLHEILRMEQVAERTGR